MQWMMTQWKPAALALAVGMTTASSGVGLAHATVGDEGAVTPAAGPDEHDRVAVIEVERDVKGNKTVRRFRMALDGRRPSSMLLSHGDGSYEITLHKREDDGAHAELQLDMKYEERRSRDSWRAEFSTSRSLAIGQRTVMSAVEGQGSVRLRVTVTLR